MATPDGWSKPLDNPLTQDDLDTLNKIINACPAVHDNIARAGAAGINLSEQTERCRDLEALARELRKQFFGIDTP